MIFLIVQDLSMHLQCPRNPVGKNVNKTLKEKTNKITMSALLTETIFPSVGMYAGLLDKRNLVCSVLKLVSSLAFCSTRGGLCLRLYVRYSSSLFCTPDKELSACRL